MDSEYFIPYLPESKLADSFDLTSNSEKKMKETIRVVDNAAMEMIRQRRSEMVTTTMTGLNKSDLLSRFMGSIEDDKY
ncbi:Cytochrome P450 [Arachis hypogaea]|nr:Cytochrome P450 [Arachis hypogaea]